jgi:hypothetical protein
MALGGMLVVFDRRYRKVLKQTQLETSARAAA